MHVGGPFEICMRAPDGTEHWSRGTFLEVVPDLRLVIEMAVSGIGGETLFQARTEVHFSDAPGGTLMDVIQTYTMLNVAIAAPMVKGAQLGWAQTLDRLAAALSPSEAPEMPKRSVVHGSFHLERTYKARPAQVYKALSDEAAKRKWFGGGDGKWTQIERHMDFRIGGTERAKGRWDSGVVTTFDAIYHDIVPEERIVYTYEMHLNEAKISVSLATMQITRVNDTETKLAITEQGAFLDGYDDAGSREHGTGWLMDKLGETL
jgi:uncharacterized protein YndB with AHSA1/START domain